VKEKSVLNPFIELVNAREGVEGSKHPVVLRESYAQFGEDAIVESLLLARLAKQGRLPGSLVYVEIGANHPITSSNTFLLYEKYGARGVLVEADPALIARLEHVRPRDTVVNAAISASQAPSAVLHVAALTELSSLRPGHTDHWRGLPGNDGVTATVEVPNLHVNAFLARYAPRDVDFLSIDCEGVDLEIVAALDFSRFTPYVLQCEPSEHIVRGSRARMIELVEGNGYRLIAVTDANLIFVRSQQASPRDLPPLRRLAALRARLALRVRRRLARAFNSRRPAPRPVATPRIARADDP
jgi:FkbM family methyltransferase